MSELRTPLTSWHEAHGAKMAPFAGWLMPIQYEGILIEHQHTRQHAGLFDICHMGEFRIEGPGADEALSGAASHNLATLAPGKCRYGFLLNAEGGVLDDCIIYRFGPDAFMIVVNAACAAGDCVRGACPRAWPSPTFPPSRPRSTCEGRVRGCAGSRAQREFS